MWRLLCIVVCTQLAVALCAVAAAPPLTTRPAEPETVYTNSRRFDIPFQLRKTTRPDEAPVEVQLHASIDGGNAWNQYDAVAPQAGKFRYQAEHDGAYWFSLRSRDVAGRLHPPGLPAAEMIVVVDTVPPAITLNARSQQKNVAHVSWSIVEQAIAAETLRLEYQAADTSVWTPVVLSIDRSRPLAALAGDLDVPLPETTTDIRFRATAVDRAGNESTAEVTLPPTAPALSPVVQGVPSTQGGGSLAADRWRDRLTGGPRAPIEEREPLNRWTPPPQQSATALTARKFPRYDPPPVVDDGGL
ncbi:MAG: hypothetical protein KDA63_07320, partial [Planctomycetales bacterium]|nr:hypothetical protein [Planctomycetales bacterium]